jgi:hypothetical protein
MTRLYFTTVPEPKTTKNRIEFCVCTEPQPDT